MPVDNDPPVGFRFEVFFFASDGTKNSLDTLFQKVSGLSSSVKTRQLEEGGQNLYIQALPETIQHENLVLQRGMVIGSPLEQELNTVMTQFTFRPSNVLITLLDIKKNPIRNWLFMNAYPIKWTISDLDAESNSVVIETVELTYQRMKKVEMNTLDRIEAAVKEEER